MSVSVCLSLHQTEIAKRLNTICAQVIPFLSQEVSMCAFELQTRDATRAYSLLSNSQF